MGQKHLTWLFRENAEGKKGYHLIADSVVECLQDSEKRAKSLIMVSVLPIAFALAGATMGAGSGFVLREEGEPFSDIGAAAATGAKVGAGVGLAMGVLIPPLTVLNRKRSSASILPEMSKP